MKLRVSELAPNALRYAGQPGHVESYFLRANDPKRPRALWLKGTVYAPMAGAAEMESWLIAFDGDQAQPIAGRESVALNSPAAESAGETTYLRAARLTFELAPQGRVVGTVATSKGEAKVDLRWEVARTPVAQPLSLLGQRILREGPFPKSKLLTPFPSLVFSGVVEVGGERIEVDRWPGMQGHNWGREHAFEYAWGQCLFAAEGVEPETMVEGFSARVRMGGRTSPRISCLVVRRGTQTLRFDRLFDLWRQEADIVGDRWTVRVGGPDGEARLEMDAVGRPIACLGYRNPNGELSYCFNTKLARTRLQVQPAQGAAFACTSEHGGALEFLRRDPDPRFPDVI